MHKNQNGFSVIELVLAVALVGLIVFAGWYALRTKNKTAQTVSPNAVSTSTPKSTNANSTLENTAQSQNTSGHTPEPLVASFSVSQWGVTFKTAQGLNKLTYRVIDNDLIGFAYTDWEALDAKCAASKGGAGFLHRYDERTLSASDGESIKQQADAKLGNYYYVYESPQAPCSQNEQIVNDQTATQPAINLRNSIHTSLESL